MIAASQFDVNKRNAPELAPVLHLFWIPDAFAVRPDDFIQYHIENDYSVPLRFRTQQNASQKTEAAQSPIEKKEQKVTGTSVIKSVL